MIEEQKTIDGADPLMSSEKQAVNSKALTIINNVLMMISLEKKRLYIGG